ncbi:MAG: hypothetical protein Q8904_05795 [Bacteroidota bacterium]|nr:hypothetical protein [Bacteroidota bacterium]
MTNEDFMTVIRQPETVRGEYLADLKEIVERYPYFTQTRLLLLKALQQSSSIHYGANLKVASVYSSSRRLLYYYLYPEKMLSTEPYQRNKAGKSTGDYFDMINSIESEGGDTKQSLKNLAEKLKSARAMVIPRSGQPVNKPVVSNNDPVKIEKEEIPLKPVLEGQNIPASMEISESNAKKMIIERKYIEAIEILRALNLNNPKKSVYFADQIRFLEKVIVNSKK